VAKQGEAGISWTDETWNPIRARYWEIQNNGSGRERLGWHCEKVSAACKHCYAEAMNLRLGTGLDYKPGNLFREEKRGFCNGEAEVFLDEKMLLSPLHWRKPRRIFTSSMTDIFGGWVKDEWLDRIWAVMALCPQHTFLPLTKRPKRMRYYMTRPHRPGQFITILDDGTRIDTPSAHICVRSAMCDLLPKAPPQALDFAAKWADDHYPDGDGFLRRWPLPNVWPGVTAEDQATANERIPDLLATPAAKRFVSIEPILGQIDLTKIQTVINGNSGVKNALTGDFWIPGCGSISSTTLRGGPKLDWVICGGESGPKARPSHPNWYRSLRDQCAAAGVPFFFKQQGNWAFCDGWEEWVPEPEPRIHIWPDGEMSALVGKKCAGRLLDGRLHNEFPEMK